MKIEIGKKYVITNGSAKLPFYRFKIGEVVTLVDLDANDGVHWYENKSGRGQWVRLDCLKEYKAPLTLKGLFQRLLSIIYTKKKTS